MDHRITEDHGPLIRHDEVHEFMKREAPFFLAPGHNQGHISGILRKELDFLCSISEFHELG
jgi:hypothetical protein